MPTSATRDGSSAGSGQPLVPEPLRRLAERGRERHPVHVPGRARLGRVEVAVRVDPDHAARLPCRGGEAGERADRDRVVAAEHERPRAFAHGLLDQRRERRAGLEDLGEEARALVHERERLGHRRRDVAAVGDREPDLGQPLVEPRVADRRRAHVDAAPGLAEVERCADDRDGTLHGAKPYSPGRSYAGGATLRRRGEVAQLVEHTAENRGVAGSSPALAMICADISPARRRSRPDSSGSRILIAGAGPHRRSSRHRPPGRRGRDRASARLAASCDDSAEDASKRWKHVSSSGRNVVRT